MNVSFTCCMLCLPVRQRQRCDTPGLFKTTDGTTQWQVAPKSGGDVVCGCFCCSRGDKLTWTPLVYAVSLWFSCRDGVGADGSSLQLTMGWQSTSSHLLKVVRKDLEKKGNYYEPLPKCRTVLKRKNIKCATSWKSHVMPILPSLFGAASLD